MLYKKWYYQNLAVDLCEYPHLIVAIRGRGDNSDESCLPRLCFCAFIACINDNVTLMCTDQNSNVRCIYTCSYARSVGKKGNLCIYFIPCLHSSCDFPWWRILYVDTLCSSLVCSVLVNNSNINVYKMQNVLLTTLVPVIVMCGLGLGTSEWPVCV